MQSNDLSSHTDSARNNNDTTSTEDTSSQPSSGQVVANSSEVNAEISREQEFVDKAYDNLDRNRSRYRRSQRQVEAQGAWGTPQARTERDAMAAHYGDQAARLEQIEDRLVFGRIDTDKDETHYIGRAGLRDEDGSRLLVDWRAPAAMPFYQATAVEPQGLVRRRHISTHLRQIRSLEDEVLNAKSATEKGLGFQGEGALMSALSQARDGRMGDIVSTIQAEQDAVIRAGDNGIMVVQGGPGTGKTAVALHRAAYLLYTDRERLERSGVLIVGPSRVFLRYIEQVLPSLGETGVVSVTFGDLLPGIHTNEVDEPVVANAKGNLAWIQILRSAVKNLQKLPASDIEFRINGKEAVLTRQAVTDARTRARRGGKPHNQAREGFALELIEVLAKQFSGEDPDPETLQWWREEVRSSRQARREINLCWMPTKATDLLSKLFSRPDYLASLNEGIRVGTKLSAEDLSLVQRSADSSMTIADIPLLDELEELLGYSQVTQQSTRTVSKAEEDAEIERAKQAIEGQQLGGGIVTAQMLAQQTRGAAEWKPLAERARSDRGWTYGHIVVDEAQDLSPMAWHSLLRRCPSRSFTVVGDLDQARGHSRPTSWFEALGPAARGLTDERTLSISYRTPKQLTDLAQSVLAEVGEPVRFPLTSAREVTDSLHDTQVPSREKLRETLENIIDDETAYLDSELGKGAGRIGVIVPTSLAKEWDADATGNSTFEQRVSLLSVVAAKGLEFDTTILVEPNEILENGPGDLFVAMTRSTRRLHSIRTAELPKVWQSALK